VPVGRVTGASWLATHNRASSQTGMWANPSPSRALGILSAYCPT
jgi:hypothetical protein